MPKKIIPSVALICCWCLSALAGDDSNNSTSQLRARGHAVATITPIFSQLVMFSLPDGFKTVHENTNAGRYIREVVLEGETVDQWSQMITVTGAEGLVANASLTPQSFLEQIAGGFKRACPDSFSAKAIGALKINGYDAFIALAGCSTVQSGGNKRSESALLISVKGSDDYYTIQWAERGPAVAQPIDLSDAKWPDRSRKLNPIKICPRMPGEVAPFPSCVGQK